MDTQPGATPPTDIVARAEALLEESRTVATMDRPRARRLAEEAVALLVQAGGGARREQAAARLRAAELAMAARDFTSAARHARETLALVGDGDEPCLVGSACVLLGDALKLQGDLVPALQALERGLHAQGEPAGVTELLRDLLLHRLDVLLRMGRLQEAEAAADRLLALAKEAGDRRLEGKVLAGVAQGAQFRGDTGRALLAFREVATIGDEVGDPFLRAMGLGSAAAIVGQQGDPGEALRLLSEALALARGAGAGDTSFVTTMLGLAREAHIARGDLAEARRCAEEGVAIARESGARRTEAEALTGLAACHRALEDMDEALRIAKIAVALNDEVGATASGLSARLELARNLRDHGDSVEADALLCEVVERSKALGLRELECLALTARADVHFAAGRLGEALRDVESALLYAREEGHLDDCASRYALAATVHERLGDTAAALRCERERARLREELQRQRSGQSLDYWRAQHELTLAQLRGERVEREAARRGEQQLRRLLETAPDAMILVRADGSLAFTNEQASRLFGRPSEQLATLRAGALVPDAQRTALEATLRDLFDRPRWRSLGVAEELHALRSDGTSVAVEISVTPFDRNGEMLLACAIRDVEERRRVQEDLRRALEEIQALKDRAEAENVYLREEIDETLKVGDVVGQSPALLGALHRLEQVAPTDASVLLFGETGSGKEVFARALHALSRRAERVLVKVDCASLPATLIESELFGHEKGAFTGAHSAKVGRFELADGGTIFLDEIGELPLDLQSKLLRVLQDREFERVGSSKPRAVDVRVIAATNRDLEAMVAEQRFRADLFYRLSVFPIRIPPLRERKQDIPMLAWHIVTLRQDRMGKRFERMSSELLRSLEAHDWPGNVRELENVVDRAMILSPAPTLQLVEQIGVATTAASPRPHGSGGNGGIGGVLPERLAETASSAVAAAYGASPQRLRDVERAHVVSMLESCGWRVKGPGNAAERLGLSPSTLRYRMAKLEILRPPR
jgi:PAS domain S-box-containing protein